MTIGQTIAAERRKLGLSQEQLGEKMGVTRQSISKWESDAALPELEKLIALSRLFRMPVGQLLGIEEPAAPETESAPAPEPAEVQQLAERIAGEYLRQQPKPRRWPRWVSLALIFGLALGLWQTSRRLSNLEQNYWSLQSSLGALRSSVSQLQDLPSSIRQLLEDVARADSLVWDAHKWLFQTYACSTVMFRDRKHLAAFYSSDPEYLRDAAAENGEINYWEWGIELTRPARSLKLWLTLQTLGTDQISDMVTHGIGLAQQTESMLRNQPEWEVVTPTQLAIVKFCYAPQGITPQQQDELFLGA